MRAVALLRSRKLAVSLLAGMLAYSWLSTLVPSSSADPAAAAAWDASHPVLGPVVALLGMHAAFSSPLFLAAALVLTLSTAACAWERSRRSWRLWKSRATVSESDLRRLGDAPGIALPREADAEAALAVSAGVLAGLGMKVRRSGRVVDGSRGTFALLGSPLFHWALVGLFVLIGVGQLTRYEGFVNVLVGQTVEDSPSGYALGLAAGPFAGSRYSGAGIRVKELVEEYVADGIDRGPSPFVEIVRGEDVVAAQWSYPNHPLSWGPIVVHMRKDGPAFAGTLRYPGRERGDPVALYWDVDAPLGASREFLLRRASAETSTVRVVRAQGRRVEVSEQDGSGDAATQTIGIGESATLSDGIVLTADALTGYAQLKVVNDWSLPWVFAMFAVGTAGAALAVFVPVRRARVMYVASTSSAGGAAAPCLRVLVTRSKTDPAFPRRVETALRAAFDVAGSSSEEA